MHYLQEDKQYVQHLIEADSEAIHRTLVLEQGSFYISGCVCQQLQSTLFIGTLIRPLLAYIYQLV